MENKQIKAGDYLVSKISEKTECKIVGMVKDLISNSIYLEVQWNFEDKTQCYRFPINVWENGITFLHYDYHSK